MKDIKLNTSFKKFQYWASWFGFIVGGALLIWLIALGLYTYGKDTPENKQKKKDILNMTYQKFIFIYGSIVVALIVIGILIGLIN